MKNKHNNSKTFTTKKWFYVAVVFGIIFAVVTTFIAICRNISTPKNSNVLKEGFVKTETKQNDVKKDTPDDVDKKTFNTIDKGEKSKDAEKNKEKENEKEDENSKKVSANVDGVEKKQKFIKPVDGTILQPYSNNELVQNKVLGDWRTHDGIDIKAKKNTSVKAIADGFISDIKNEEGTWGVCITVDHKNGFKSFYKGLSEQLQVKLDEKVKAGDVIATVGVSNIVEKNLPEHLHFMLEKDGEWVNPKDYFNF